MSRPVDHAALFARRRSASVGVSLEDQETDSSLFGSPIERVTTATTPATRGRMALGATRGGGLRRGGFRTPRSVRDRIVYGSPSSGRENTHSTRRGSVRGRRGSSVLPSYYPRTPLRDITSVVRVMMLHLFSLLILRVSYDLFLVGLILIEL